MNSSSSPTKDRDGKPVHVGQLVRVVCLTGPVLDEVEPEAQHEVLSMIGEVFEVDSIVDGRVWVFTGWQDADNTANHLLVDLQPHEMKVVSP